MVGFLTRRFIIWGGVTVAGGARGVSYWLAWDHMIVGLHLLGARLKSMSNVLIRIPYITIFDGAIATLASLNFKLRLCAVDILLLVLLKLLLLMRWVQ